jgi:hypothetical protein
VPRVVARSIRRRLGLGQGLLQHRPARK